MELIHSIYRDIIMKIKSDNTISLLLEEKKITTNDDLVQLFDCSRKTAQRHLKALGAINSYNQYGRFYTLTTIADFNQYGIWSYKDACFSKFGNLRQTLIGVVTQSEMGLSGEQLGKKMKINENSFLSHFRHDTKIHREKFNNRFVYFSSQPQRKSQQIAHRRKEENPSELPNDTQAIMILVQCIKSPKASTKEIAKMLKFSLSSINCLLAYHSIKFKKKR